MQNIIVDKIRTVAAKIAAREKLSQGERNLIVNILNHRADYLEHTGASTANRPKTSTNPKQANANALANKSRQNKKLRELMRGVE